MTRTRPPVPPASRSRFAGKAGLLAYFLGLFCMGFALMFLKFHNGSVYRLCVEWGFWISLPIAIVTMTGAFEKFKRR